MKKLLGYRLKEEFKEYRQASLTLGKVSHFFRTRDYDFNESSNVHDRLKQAGVMHWFEEVYEDEKLEVGKWYKVTNLQNGCLGFKGIGMCTKESPQSGLDERDNGCNLKEPNGRVWRVNGCIEPAATEEIQQALIKEATKRGFKEGVVIDNSGLNDVIWKQDGNPINRGGFYFEPHNNKLILGQKWVFKDGKWAEILPNETLNGKTAIIDGVEYELKIKN